MEFSQRLRGWARPVYTQFSKLMAEQVEQTEDGFALPNEQDAVTFSDVLLQDAVRGRASDIHLEPDSNGIRIRFRIDGVLLDTMMLEAGPGWNVLRHVKAMFGLDPVPAVRPASTGRQLNINGLPMDIRASVAPCVFGEKVTLRLLNLPQQIQQIGRLGMEPEAEAQIQDWAEHVAGTFIVCGPTGSGKTTTLFLEEYDDQKIRRHLLGAGHHFMLDDALDKVTRGITDLRQVRALTSSH